MEKYIGEMLTFIVFVILLLSLVIGGQIFYRTAEYNNFRTQAIKIVSRTGGFNENACNQINWIANQYYNHTDGKGNNAKKLVIYAKPYTKQNLQELNNPQKKDSNPEQFSANQYEQVGYNQPIKFLIYIKMPDAALISHESTSNHVEMTLSQVRSNSQDSIDQY